MARKKINTNTGGTGQFGAVDGITQINELLTGVDQSSTDPVDINTNWTFADSKCKIANPANTFAYTIKTSTLTAPRILTLPNYTSLTSDSFVTLAHPQTLTGKTIDRPTGTGGTISSVVGPDLMLYPTSYVRTGGWAGGVNTNGFGFCNAVLSSTGTITYPLSTTDGKMANIATSTTANNNAGTRGSAGSGVIRALKARFFCRFRVNTTSTRLFLGWVNDNAAFPAAGDNPLNSKSGVLFGLRAADTNWQIIQNGGSATNVFQALGTADTNIHTIELRANTANTNFEYSLDGAAFAALTDSTNIPASTTILYPWVVIQNGGTTPAKTMDQWHWFSQLTEPSIG